MSDRGMIKWNSFNALLAHTDSIEKLYERRLKISKPILTEDTLVELNYAIKQAIDEEKIVTVYYYSNGHIKKANGLITKVNVYNKCLVVGKTQLDIENILNIEH